jgi:uncharacterized membrane protein
MSNKPAAQHESEVQTKEGAQSGNVGRIFLSLLTLGLAAASVVLASLKDGEFFQDLLLLDGWKSQLIGNLHPILMLLPMGLIFMVVIVDVLGWLSFGRWKPATLTALFFIVMTSVLASLSGLVLMKLEGNSGAEWSQYMWCGIGATGSFALSFICKIWGKGGNDRGIVYAVFLLCGTAALGYGGYVYGQKVHAFTLIPSETELTTPFGNQTVREQMSALIIELDASNEELEGGLVKKDNEISQVTSAQNSAEESYRGEQKKLVAAEKSVGELKLNVLAAQKKTIETLKQIEAGNKEKSMLQKQIENLKAEIEALKKQATTVFPKSVVELPAESVAE